MKARVLASSRPRVLAPRRCAARLMDGEKSATAGTVRFSPALGSRLGSLREKGVEPAGAGAAGERRVRRLLGQEGTGLARGKGRLQGREEHVAQNRRSSAPRGRFTGANRA